MARNVRKQLLRPNITRLHRCSDGSRRCLPAGLFADLLDILVDQLRLTHLVQLRGLRQRHVLEERIVRPGVVIRHVVDVPHAIARADARRVL